MGRRLRRAERAAHGKAGERAGRLGLAARGAMYCVAGGLAIRLVTGDNERVDKEGALEAMARQPVGSVLLGALAVGFAGYAVWRLLRAFTGDAEGEPRSGNGRNLRRLADIGRALVYVALFTTTVRVLFGGLDEVGGPEEERDLTVTVMSYSWGQPVVLAAGLATIAAGVILAVRGLQRDFDDNLDSKRVPAWARRVVPIAGTVGYISRGSVIALAGWFVTVAAWQFDSQEAVGVAGALGRLAGDLAGRVALSGVAFGLLSFGVFSFVESLYRKVLED